MIKRLFVLNLFLILLVNLILCDQGAKLAVIKSSNQNFDFSNKQALKLSDFKNLLLAGAGFSTEKPIEWNGLKKDATSEYPRATVLFLVNNNQTDIKSFSTQYIQINEDVDADFDYLKSATNGYDVSVRYFDGLPSENDLKTLADDCSHLASFFVIRVKDSESGDLAKPIDKILNAFYRHCVSDSNDLVSYLLATNIPKRAKRQVKEADVKDDRMITNEATFYSDQYPAMFNLIFWSSLILALAVFGISYSMWNMDPGLDTVIYRMTSQRIKKDQ